MSALQRSQIKCQQKWKTLGFWKNGAHNGVRVFWENLIFWDECFFKNLHKLFFGLYDYVRSIWRVHLTHIFAPIITSWPHNTPIRFYERESEKSSYFEKNEAQNEVGIIIQTNPSVWAETFFQRPLEKFLWTFHTLFTSSFVFKNVL